MKIVNHKSTQNQAGVGGSSPLCTPLDFFGSERILINSTPAKPLTIMLNSGGFFFSGRVS